MADSKITALASISTSTDPAVDPLVIVDVSDTSMAATGTTKKVTLNNLLSSSPTATGAFSVTGLVTAGSATITGDLTVDTSTLKVDATNHRVGIGTASPAYLVDVLAAGASTVNDSFNIARFTGASAVANDLSLVGPATSQVRLNFSHPTASGNGEVGYDHATNNLRFVTAGTQKGAFNSTGAFVLAGGDITANGTGVNFPATQAASSNANTLDDYEEGTFTPTVAGSTTAGTGTYVAQNGYYTKVGNLVTAKVFMVWTAHTGTGNMNFAGLPFTSNSGTNSYSAASIGYFSNIALTALNVMTLLNNPATSYIEALQYPAGGGASGSVPIDTAGAIMYTVTYTV